MIILFIYRNDLVQIQSKTLYILLDIHKKEVSYELKQLTQSDWNFIFRCCPLKMTLKILLKFRFISSKLLVSKVYKDLQNEILPTTQILSNPCIFSNYVKTNIL